jgi:hypothetical protein
VQRQEFLSLSSICNLESASRICNLDDCLRGSLTAEIISHAPTDYFLDAFIQATC